VQKFNESEKGLCTVSERQSLNQWCYALQKVVPFSNQVFCRLWATTLMKDLLDCCGIVIAG